MTQTDEGKLYAHELLKARVRSKQNSFRQIAADLGVCASSITLVSQRKSRSRRIEKALADVVGCTPEELFEDPASQNQEVEMRMRQDHYLPSARQKSMEAKHENIEK